MFRSTWICIVALGLGACGADTNFESRSAEGKSLNGKSLNGKSLNGKSLNGKSLNGSTLGSSIVWVSLENVKLAGSTLRDTTLDATVFHGTRGHAAHVQGESFDGARFTAESDEGHALDLRIADIDVPAAPDEVWRYWVEYRETDGHWYPICQDEAGAFAAIPIRGWWNPSTGGKVEDSDRFTFACPEIGAIGKCVELGYRPWSAASGASLDGHHQACVRLLRADFCGDGDSYTVDGTLLNLYDDVGVQDDTESWLIEAEWDEDGARCLSVNHRDALLGMPCGLGLSLALPCGDTASFDSGTLLMSETPDLL